MIGNVVYDNKSFYDFGITLALCENPYEVATPNVDTTHIDGMNGDVHYYYGDYSNVDLKYKCLIDRDFDVKFAEFKSWLFRHRGYSRLEDYVYPDEYRMAVPLKATSITKTRNAFEMTFNCKPQRFLKSGEQWMSFSTDGTIRNPTQFEAKPLIRVHGNGFIQIGDRNASITNNRNSYIDIDCDVQDAYRGSVNCNKFITLNSGEFFTLESGENSIILSSGMSAEIQPRWYRI